MDSRRWRSLAWAGLAAALVACRSAGGAPTPEARPPIGTERLEERVTALEQENERLAGQAEDLAHLLFELRDQVEQVLRVVIGGGLPMASLEATMAEEREESMASGGDFPDLVATLPADPFWESSEHVGLLRALYRRTPEAALDVLYAVQGAPESLEQFAQALCETGLSSRVRFVTDEPGALVHWSFLGRDEDLEADAPTNESEAELCIGLYRFWTVRDGERSSPEKQLPVIDEEVTVVLEEDDR